MSRQIALGAEARTSFPSTSGAPQVTSVIKDGVLYHITYELIPIVGTSWYSGSFTAVETGVYEFIVDNVLIGIFEVVTRDVFSFLNNIEDQALGSWSWDKETKIMTLFRQDGSTLGTYEADDTLENAYSRISIPSS